MSHQLTVSSLCSALSLVALALFARAEALSGGEAAGPLVRILTNVGVIG